MPVVLTDSSGQNRSAKTLLYHHPELAVAYGMTFTRTRYAQYSKAIAARSRPRSAIADRKSDLPRCTSSTTVDDTSTSRFGFNFAPRANCSFNGRKPMTLFFARTVRHSPQPKASCTRAATVESVVRGYQGSPLLRFDRRHLPVRPRRRLRAVVMNRNTLLPIAVTGRRGSPALSRHQSGTPHTQRVRFHLRRGLPTAEACPAVQGAPTYPGPGPSPLPQRFPKSLELSVRRRGRPRAAGYRAEQIRTSPAASLRRFSPESVPTTMFVPSLTVIGRSVFSRSVRHGTPRMVVSS